MFSKSKQPVPAKSLPPIITELPSESVTANPKSVANGSASTQSSSSPSLTSNLNDCLPNLTGWFSDLSTILTTCFLESLSESKIFLFVTLQLLRLLSSPLSITLLKPWAISLFFLS